METVGTQLQRGPTNPIYDPGYVTQSDKIWARNYPSLRNLVVHTVIDENGMTHANFEPAFLPLYADDDVRMNEPAFPPNNRTWRLQSEADCELWFHTEISNVVLPAWSAAQIPVMQSSHIKPPREDPIPEEVDAVYSIKFRNTRTVLAIGEMKRNLIQPEYWQGGNVTAIGAQKKLSKELRGYVFSASHPSRVGVCRADEVGSGLTP